MYSEKFIRQVLKAAAKSSVLQAARQFEVAYSTIREWQKAAEKKKFATAEPTRKSIINDVDDASLHAVHSKARHREFVDFCNNLQPFQRIAVLFIRLQTREDLPNWLLVAFDLKCRCLNFCLTEESNKSNKALYLLYLNNFLKNRGESAARFISNILLTDIETVQESAFERSISHLVGKLVQPLKTWLEKASSLPEMLTKSYIFSADYNLGCGTSAFLHPPFVLDSTMDNFDFKNNSLMINRLSESAAETITKITAKYSSQEQPITGLSHDRLLEIYDYFTRLGQASRLVEEKLVQDAGLMLLTGELSRSELLLKNLLKNPALTIEGRSSLYYAYGQQKVHQAQYAAAIRYYKKSISCCRQCANLTVEFAVLQNMCMLFLHRADVQKAYRYLRMAQKCALSIKSDAVYARYYFLSGYYFYSRNDLKLAIKEYEQSAVYAAVCRDTVNYHNAVSGISTTLTRLNKHKPALKYALKAYSSSLQTGQLINISFDRIICADCYLNLSDYRKAEELLLVNLKELQDQNYLVLQFQTAHVYFNLLIAEKRVAEAGCMLDKLKGLIAAGIDNPLLINALRESEVQMQQVLKQS